MRAIVQYQPRADQPLQPVPGEWIMRNLFLPDTAREVLEDAPLMKAVRDVVTAYPGSRNPKMGTLWAIISYKAGVLGSLRPEESHATGNAVDLAPMYADARITGPDMRSIRLSEKVHFLSKLASIWTPSHPALFAEGDHLHIEKSMQGGVVASYHTYRPAYKNDAELVGFTPLQNKAFRVHPDGTTTRFIPVRSRDLSGRLVPWNTVNPPNTQGSVRTGYARHDRDRVSQLRLVIPTL